MNHIHNVTHANTSIIRIHVHIIITHTINRLSICHNIVYIRAQLARVVTSQTDRNNIIIMKLNKLQQTTQEANFQWSGLSLVPQGHCDLIIIMHDNCFAGACKLRTVHMVPMSFSYQKIDQNVVRPRLLQPQIIMCTVQGQQLCLWQLQMLLVGVNRYYNVI